MIVIAEIPDSLIGITSAQKKLFWFTLLACFD